MKKTGNTNLEPQVFSLATFASDNQVPLEMFDRVRQDLHTSDILSSVLICPEQKKVVLLSDDIIVSRYIDTEMPVSVLDYYDWSKAESESLSNDYDRARFNRSTAIENLTRKVREHQQYSFIARCKNGSDTDSVIKYTFVCYCPKSCYILGTRQEITQSLEHDVLTGGLNRDGLLRELKNKFATRPEGVDYSILSFNIKNFRIINELHGNEVGDKVLQHMYTSIVYSDLHPISYARYESDTFICLIRRENLDTDVISHLCQQECLVGDKKIVYRSLCGVYHLTDEEEVTPFNACAHAKLATTFVKDQFITPWMTYEPQMMTSAISDSEVLNRLDGAMERREFEPYFQPVVNTQTGRIEMAEALVRWKSEKHGMISPALFIPVLERHGGLSRIDQMMEERVFALQQKRLSEGQPVVPIDLNLSWTDFADTKLISQLQDHILDESVPTDLMRYEITESTYDEIAENRMDVLNFFQNNNVKLLVDDFGQGYSFGTMKNVDFHIIKLDKSLIDKIEKSRKMDLLIETLIGVFHNLNAKVVAEGVEDKKQVEFLKRVGCDYIQGYYFYRPMDEQAFLELLDSQNRNDNLLTTSVDGKAEKPEATPSAVWVERDVLEKQYAKMQQAAEETKCLRMLLDEMDIHIFEWNVHTHEDLASDKFCRIYGLPSNVIPNMPEEIPIVIEEDRDRFREFYYRIARGEKMGSDSFRLYKPDGKGYTWYRKTFYTLFDQKGLPSKAVITMQDCEDEYHYQILRTRDRLMTQKMEIVTFIYTLTNDTFSFNYPGPNGEVLSQSIPNYLNTPEDQMTQDHLLLSEAIRNAMNSESRIGHIDFFDQRLNTEFRAHYALVDGEYGQLYAIIGQAEDINKTRERMAAAEQLIRMSEIDGLTQIRNRYSGEKTMSELLKSREPGVFGILDCDKFKSVNDTFGHVIGDQLLIAIAKAMGEVNRSAINMRLGGDEFAFYVTGSYTHDEIVEKINLFFDAVNRIHVPGMEGYPISVSVGAVVYSGEEGVDFDSLYRKADILLYQSKETTGNKLTI